MVLFLPSFSFQKVSFEGKTYSLERADTDAKRSLGLGERDTICETCGMVFVFERPDVRGFWMKGMRFSLDIVWLLDNTVVHIERHISPDSKETYRPPVFSDRVLEFRAGATEGLEVGEEVRFSWF